MGEFDFLNTRKIVDAAFSDKRKKGAKTAYARFRELARGGKPKIEDYEIEAFYDHYKEQDEAFRKYMDDMIN